MELKQLERVYSRYAPVYDRLFGRAFDETRAAAIHSLEVGPGERVLEVGVGTGLALCLYPRHCSLTGIDLSPRMLARAGGRVRDHALTHVRLIRMDAGNMGFADDRFDTVFAAYVVTAVPDYRRLMREMVRVCRHGGRIVLLNHFVNGNDLIDIVERAVSPLCERIGFRTDLSVAQVLDGSPVVVERHERVKPFGRWHLLECQNRKGGRSS